MKKNDPNSYFSHEPVAPRPRLRRSIVALGVVLVSLVVLPILLVQIALRFPGASKYILSVVEAGAGDRLGARVHIAGVTTNVWSRVRVSGISIQYPNGDSLAISSIVADYNLPGLFRNNYSLPRVSVTGLRANLTRRSSGVALFNGLAVKNKRKPGVKLEWQVIGLTDAEISYFDSLLKFSAKLSLPNAKVLRKKNDRIDVSLVRGKGSFEGPWWNGAVWSLVTDVEIGKNAISVSRCEVVGNGISLNGAGVIPFSADSAWRIEGSLLADIDQSPFLRAMAAGFTCRGQSKLASQIVGTPRYPTITASLRMRSPRWKSFWADSLTVEASYNGDSLREVLARAMGGEIGSLTIRGHGSLANLFNRPTLGTYGASISARHLGIDSGMVAALPRDLRMLSVERANFVLTGHGPDSLPTEGSMDVTLRLPNQDTMTSKIVKSGDRWDIVDLWDGNVLEAHGIWNTTGEVQADFSGKLVSLGSITSAVMGEKVDGSALVSGSLSGPISKPSVDFSIDQGNLAWRGMDAFDVSAHAEYQHGVFSIIDGRAAIQGDISGAVDFFHAGPFSGHASAKLEAHGTLDSLSIKGPVQIDRVAVAHYSIGDIGTRFSLEHGTIACSDLVIKTPNVVLRGSAESTIRMPLAFNLDLSSKGDAVGSTAEAGWIKAHATLRRDTVAGLVEWSAVDAAILEPFSNSIPFTGTLSGRTSFAHTLSNPSATAEIVWTKAELGKGICADATARFSVADSFCTADATVSPAGLGGAIHVTTGVPFALSKGWHIDTSGLRPGTISITATNLDLGMARLLPDSEGRTSGTLDCRVSAALAGALWPIAGTISISKGAVAVKTDSVAAYGVEARFDLGGTIAAPILSVTSSADSFRVKEMRLFNCRLNGRTAASTLAIDTFACRIGRGSVSASGLIHLDARKGLWGFPISARIIADTVPLISFNPLLEGVSFESGSATANLDLTTDSLGARWSGAALLRRAVVSIPPIVQPLGPLNATIKVRGDSLILDTVNAEWGGGKVRLSGTALFGSTILQGVRIDASGKHIGLSSGSDLSATIEAFNVEGEGSQKGLAIEGQVSLAKASYRNDYTTADLVAALRGRPSIGADSVTPRGFTDNSRVDLTLSAPSSVTADLGIARVTGGGKVRITGPMRKPRIAGDLEVSEGYVYYLDRKFTVTKGQFRQVNVMEMNPDLDLSAEVVLAPSSGVKQATKYTVTLTLSGTLNNPVVSLSSDPALGNVDIVSLLTLGRVRNNDSEILQLQSGNDFTSLLVDRARQLAGQQISGYASRAIERLLYLDNVTIEGGLLNVQHVSFTKQIIDPLSITYDMVVGHTNEQQIKLSYRLFRHLYLVGETDQNGNAGLDFTTKLSF